MSSHGYYSLWRLRSDPHRGHHSLIEEDCHKCGACSCCVCSCPHMSLSSCSRGPTHSSPRHNQEQAHLKKCLIIEKRFYRKCTIPIYFNVISSILCATSSSATKWTFILERKTFSIIKKCFNYDKKGSFNFKRWKFEFSFYS